MPKGPGRPRESASTAKEIAGRLGALSVDEGASSVETLSELQIISKPAQDSLDVQREVRDLSQHVYVELTVSALRDAVIQQMDSTPRIIGNIASWVDTLIKAADSDDYGDLIQFTRVR